VDDLRKFNRRPPEAAAAAGAAAAGAVAPTAAEAEAAETVPVYLGACSLGRLYFLFAFFLYNIIINH
jgi:hypothetical protein